MDYNQFQHPQQRIYPHKGKGRGISITCMILGIISLILLCFWNIPIPCAIVSLIVSIISLVLCGVSLKNKCPGRSMTIIGLILSSISLVLDILVIAGVITLWNSLN